MQRYTLADLVKPAVRENNKKRRNLLVNLYQAKHIPAVPSKTLSLFGDLAALADTEAMSPDETIVIAFAETATAIGAAAAEYLGNCIFMHTSRENIPEKYCVADFSETHSHAAEQFLFSKNGSDIFKDVRLVILAEDELTTGNTMLSLIKILKTMTGSGCRFTALSLINGMNEDNFKTYEDEKINVRYLVRLDNSLDLMNREISITPLPDTLPHETCKNITFLEIEGMTDPRLGCCFSDYKNACDKMTEKVINELHSVLDNKKTVDVIGTEECMYPAVRLGLALEKAGFDVRSHSTTRSPIVPAKGDDYPLYERHKLHSFYDTGRTTYLYNLYPCDLTVLLTDSDNVSQEAVNLFAQTVKSDTLAIVKWRKES